MNNDLALVWNTIFNFTQGLINVFEAYFITRFALGLVLLGLVVGVLNKYLFHKKK